MAVDAFSDRPTRTGISPRISFSGDLNDTDDEDLSVRRSDSGSDFVFCVAGGFSHQISSADELFSNGKILPMQLLHSVPHSPNRTLHSLQSSRFRSQSQPSSSKKMLKEFLSEDIEEEDNDEEQEEEEEDRVSFKSLWQFRRSSSLNCDATTHGKSLIRSLQFLSRSNSTGSALNPKQSEIPKEAREKQRLQKQSSVSSRRSSSSSSSSSSSTYYFYSSSQKHFLQNNRGSSGNGVRISPVLNLPQAYIPKGSMSFFGFDSLFCNGKVNRKKKK